MEYTDIFVAGSAQNVKQAIQQAFEYNKFTVVWQSEFDGKAMRGSKGANVVLGGFAQYHEIEFKIMTAADNSQALRLIKTSSGWVGGALGAHKVKKQYAEIVDGLTNYFQNQGLYKGRNPL